MITFLYLGILSLSTSVAATIFYHLGYRRGYSNARHHRFCGVHMGDYCDCGEHPNARKDHSMQELLR